MMNISTHDVPATQRFGRFLLDPHRRELLADGVPVTIGSRAFDVLLDRPRQAANSSARTNS